LIPFPECLSKIPLAYGGGEAFVISTGYAMGDPLVPSEVEGNREGEAWNTRNDFMALVHFGDNSFMRPLKYNIIKGAFFPYLS
jgi:hypothetical protein